jgi:hypothetical protein
MLLFTNSDVRFYCLILNVTNIFEQYANVIFVCVISIFHHEVDEIYTLLGCYAAYGGFLDLQLGLIGGPEASIRNYHFTLCNIPEECGFQYFSSKLYY